jgi:hypothetical protein
LYHAPIAPANGAAASGAAASSAAAGIPKSEIFNLKSGIGPSDFVIRASSFLTP